MKTILVPTDFSEIANNATLFAFKLAKKNKARVILLHTYNFPIIDGQAMNLNAGVLYDNLDLNEFEHFRMNNQKLYKLAEEKNVQITEMYHKLVLGELISTIKECIKEDNVDFMILGTSGGDDWFSKILGSNTDSIIATVQVPTLIIPKNYQIDEELQTIGFTTRFRVKDKPALRKTIEFGKELGLETKCFYAQEEESERETILIGAWKEEFEPSNIEFVVSPTNNVLDTIQFFIAHYSIDILVMVTYKRDFFTELFTRRFTQKVSHNIEIPLLVLHE